MEKVINSREDLQAVQQPLKKSFQDVHQAIDKKTEAPIDLAEWKSSRKDSFGRLLLEQEDRLEKSLIEYERTLTYCKVSPLLNDNEKADLQLQLDQLREGVDQEKGESQRTLVLGKAKLLTQYFWAEIEGLKKDVESLDQKDLESLNAIQREFDAKNLGEIIDLYRGVLLDLNKQYPSETSRDGIGGTLQKGADLEVKEDLILAFIELKRLIKQTVPEVFQRLRAIRAQESEGVQQILSQFSSYLERNPTRLDQGLEKAFVKKAVSGPQSLANYALYAASKQPNLSPSQASGIGGAMGGLTVGFSLPATAFSIYKMGSIIYRHQKVAEHLSESKKIEKYAQELIHEGESLQRYGLQKRTLASSQAEASLAQKEADQGSSLLSLGYELREKAKITRGELKKESTALKGDLFMYGAMSASQLASSASGVGAIVKTAVSSFGTTAASAALGWVGIAGAGIGVVVGGVATGITIKKIIDVREEIGHVYEHSKKLETYRSEAQGDPLLTDILEKEETLQFINEKKLRVAQRNHWITLAGNVLVVVAGILGIAAFVASGVASGGITFAVIGVVGLILVIAAAHFFIKIQWKKELLKEELEKKEDWDLWMAEITRQIQQVAKGSKQAEALSKILEIPEEEMDAFLHAPEVFLKKHFL